jgi:hypothetical protein
MGTDRPAIHGRNGNAALSPQPPEILSDVVMCNHPTPDFLKAHSARKLPTYESAKSPGSTSSSGPAYRSGSPTPRR